MSERNQQQGQQDRQQGRRRNQNQQREKPDGPKRDLILELSRFQDKRIRVKFTHGRQVTGILKGFDQLMNLVLDDVQETLRDPEDESILTEKTRDLGLVVVRGPLLLTIAPVDGSEVIENPFVQPQEE
ncbi:hypothetical protein WICANDRAFT_76577 [Wickerhamomyces anomalus NRRL Y-366-8]|uniref:Sm domain-containing protein n=1 Tax=Wickerhamomyces anomalus (strain ATCC 58044 / CBS 1984 / NCYC 433 / NRRL Y-366-8) TaxID=683960 RepID=A0A1E3PBZ8_WICAA|nr:uncharacterized protein WICANDRAFT_76577 [Wickerhamomyces anomalus NRRL Y-366-8]ODQ62407.1 hypothetical protein WICANDRAFT_76577 [Wickerhamomyces anomalus NRRL Y-366-8]